MSATHKRYMLSKPQTLYLKELIEDDLENTDLTREERQQAEGILSKVNNRLESWDSVIEPAEDRADFEERIKVKS